MWMRREILSDEQVRKPSGFGHAELSFTRYGDVKQRSETSLVGQIPESCCDSDIITLVPPPPPPQVLSQNLS